MESSENSVPVSKKNSILASMGLTKSVIECENEIDVTNFVLNDRIEIGTKGYLCNKQHTIATLLIEQLDEILQVWNLDDEAKTLTEGEYYGNLEMLGKYPLWEELKDYYQLSSPKYFVYREGFPMIIVYEKSAYIIAPTIDKKEEPEYDNKRPVKNGD